jgi:signal transduction histidine kinase
LRAALRADKYNLDFDSEFKGTGISLSIVNRIINKHHGKVWAESQPNERSIFYFMLPKIVDQ